MEIVIEYLVDVPTVVGAGLEATRLGFAGRNSNQLEGGVRRSETLLIRAAEPSRRKSELNLRLEAAVTRQPDAFAR